MTTFLNSLRAILLMLLLAVSEAHAAPGDLDPLNANVVGTYVSATAEQPDGKTILVGSFTSVLGVPRSSIARLNADGTLDTGFDPKANGEVYSVAVQADGKVLLCGNFTTLQSSGAGAAISRQRIGRLNADGMLDTGFDPKAGGGSVLSMAVQVDGKVLLGGNFRSLQPNGAVSATARNRIARVNADGTLDNSFNPNASDMVLSMAVQPDGKVLLGGLFTTISATERWRIARVNTNGTLDIGFDPKTNSHVFSVAVQADGKVLLGGGFTWLQPNGAGAVTVRQYIARVNADGTLDSGFDPKADGGSVLSLTVQADGKVLLGGSFTSLQPNGAGVITWREGIARVKADGSLDTTFNPRANSTVYSVAAQADGKVLLGGYFSTLQPNSAPSPTARSLFARVLNDPATQTLSAPDTMRAQWTRGGSAPELSRVTFEVSTNGGTTWGAPIAGTRIDTTANWQRTGLSLPASGHLRARGATTTGNQNGSSGLIEQVTAFTFNTALQQWKLTHLSDANAPDLGDPDGDGVVTLAEYGINTLPQTANAAPHPASRFTYAEGERLRLFLQRDPSHNDVTVIAESAGSLAGPWAPLATSTLGGPFTGPGYVSGDDATPGVKTVEIRDTVNITDAAGRFMRVRVVRA